MPTHIAVDRGSGLIVADMAMHALGIQRIETRPARGTLELLFLSNE